MGFQGAVRWDEGKAAEGRETVARSLALWKQAGNKWGIGWANCTLAHISLDLDRLDDARNFVEQGLAVCMSTSGRYPQALGVHARACVDAVSGETRRAIEGFEEALRVRLNLSDGIGLAECMENIVRWLNLAADASSSRRLVECALDIRRESGAPPPPRIHTVYRSVGIDAAVFAATLDADRLSEKEALERALADPMPLSSIEPAYEVAQRHLDTAAV